MLYLKIGLIAALVILGGLYLNAEHRLDNANQEIGRLNGELEEAVNANAGTLVSFRKCQAINKTNAKQRAVATKRAVAAEARAAELAKDLEDLNSEPFVPTDTKCRDLGDPLPTDFINWLCIKAAENCDQG